MFEMSPAVNEAFQKLRDGSTSTTVLTLTALTYQVVVVVDALDTRSAFPVFNPPKILKTTDFTPTPSYLRSYPLQDEDMTLGTVRVSVMVLSCILKTFLFHS